jgi:hypothetical protein
VPARQAARPAEHALAALVGARCGSLRGATARQALPALRRLHARITWAGAGSPAAVPGPAYRVTGGRVLSPGVISIRVSAGRPGQQKAGQHDRGC